jgi:hypothetical protein
MSFVAITLCGASQRVFIVASIYFFIDAVRKLLDTPLYFVKITNPHYAALPDFSYILSLNDEVPSVLYS